MLTETNIMVENMKKELTLKQPMLERAAAAAANLLIEVTADQKEAERVKQMVMEEEKTVTAQTQEAQLIRDDTQRDLDKVRDEQQEGEEYEVSLSHGPMCLSPCMYVNGGLCCDMCVSGGCVGDAGVL